MLPVYYCRCQTRFLWSQSLRTHCTVHSGPSFRYSLYTQHCQISRLLHVALPLYIPAHYVRTGHFSYQGSDATYPYLQILPNHDFWHINFPSNTEANFIYGSNRLWQFYLLYLKTLKIDPQMVIKKGSVTNGSKNATFFILSFMNSKCTEKQKYENK